MEVENYISIDVAICIHGPVLFDYLWNTGVKAVGNVERREITAQ